MPVTKSQCGTENVGYLAHHHHASRGETPVGGPASVVRQAKKVQSQPAHAAANDMVFVGKTSCNEGAGVCVLKAAAYHAFC